jgi:type IV secretory pathway VirB2 component (pilin)
VNPDLTADAGPLGPGVAELLQALTAEPAGRELAGEQAALTMFRANVPPAASAPAAAPAPGAPVPVAPRFGRPGQRRDRRLLAGRLSIRLAAAATVVVTGGFAAAAYASALPEPVQHLAYRILGPIGVPDSSHHASSAPPTRHTGPAAGHRHHQASGASSSPSAAASPAASSPGSAQPSGSALAGPDQLTARASSTEIMAGTAVTVTGRLTSSGGAGTAGTVLLYERPAATLTWHLVGSGQASSTGNVAVTVAVVRVNAAFRLLGPGDVVSPPAYVTVLPTITVRLRAGAKGVVDELVVSTRYARRGDSVVLQTLAPGGSWTSAQEQTLTAAGKARFLIDAKKLQNDQIRVVLLATARHGEAVSSPVTVPPPGG